MIPKPFPRFLALVALTVVLGHVLTVVFLKTTKTQKDWLKPGDFRAARKHMPAAKRLEKICRRLPTNEPTREDLKNTTDRT